MRGFAAGAATLAGVLMLTSACASSGPKVTDNEVTKAELAIRSAENATATQHARDLLDRSRANLSAAQNERAKGNYDHARTLLEESRAAAGAAESKANAMRLEEKAAGTKRQNDEIEVRIRAFNEQAQKP